MGGNRTGRHSPAPIPIPPGMLMLMDIEIIDERHGPLGEYRLVADGADVGELAHRTDGTVRTFTHTGVRPAFEGQGLAARLVRRGLDDARAEGLTVVPQCSYVVTFLRQHPEDADLVAH